MIGEPNPWPRHAPRIQVPAAWQNHRDCPSHGHESDGRGAFGPGPGYSSYESRSSSSEAPHPLPRAAAWPGPRLRAGNHLPSDLSLWQTGIMIAALAPTQSRDFSLGSAKQAAKVAAAAETPAPNSSQPAAFCLQPPSGVFASAIIETIRFGAAAKRAGPAGSQNQVP